MMQQASYEFGFDADDIPLMIEAIPLNSECIVLVITKVEDPEELDTRFSSLPPPSTTGTMTTISATRWTACFQSLSEGADDVLDLFKKIHDSHLAESVPDNAAGKGTQRYPQTQILALTSHAFMALNP